MTPASPLLSRGTAAAKAGDRHLARQLLSQAVQQDPGSESGWLWLSSVLGTTQGRAFCLRQALEVNPQNQLVRRALATLIEAGPRAAEPAEPRAPTGRIPSAPASTFIPPAPAPVRAEEPGPPREVAPGAPAPASSAALPWPVRLAEPGPPTAIASSTPAPARRPVPVESTAPGPLSAAASSVLALLARARAAQLSPRQQRIWQITIAVLAIIALALVGTLRYALLGRPAVPGAELLAAAAPPPDTTASPTVHSTLRPTYTTTPIRTPTTVPTLTPRATSTATSAPTDTSTPTAAPTVAPLPSATRASAPATLLRSVAATATRTPLPQPALPPCNWDPRLDALGVRVERAPVGAGQVFWRLVEARWANERESAGRHAIFIEVLNPDGARAVGQTVVAQWPGGSVVVPVKNPPPPDWPADFAMYNTLGSYAISVTGAPSDRVVGMGLGTVDDPGFKVHTSFYLTFQLVRR